MGTPLPKSEKLQRIDHDHYINRLEELDYYYENSSGGFHNEVKTLELRGFIDYEGGAEKYVHHIYTVAQGIRLLTQGVLDHSDIGERRFLVSPDNIEFYESWIEHPDINDKFNINTLKPELAWEVHASFFERMKAQKPDQEISGRNGLEWLEYQSKFSKMRSDIDKSFPLIDRISISVRKRLRALETNPRDAA